MSRMLLAEVLKLEVANLIVVETQVVIIIVRERVVHMVQLTNDLTQQIKIQLKDPLLTLVKLSSNSC